jgi:hypothetical protein
MVDIVSTVVNDVIVVAGVAGTVFGFAKSKWFATALQVAKKEEPVIVQAVEDVIHTPVAKAIEAKLHHELNSVSDELKKSALAHYALAVVHGAGKVYDEMSEAEKAAAIAFVKAHLPKNIVVNEKEIVAALKSAESVAAEFKVDPAYQKALEFAQLLENANKVEEPAQQEAAPTQPQSQPQAQA